MGNSPNPANSERSLHDLAYTLEELTQNQNKLVRQTSEKIIRSQSLNELNDVLLQYYHIKRRPDSPYLRHPSVELPDAKEIKAIDTLRKIPIARGALKNIDMRVLHVVTHGGVSHIYDVACYKVPKDAMNSSVIHATKVIRNRLSDPNIPPGEITAFARKIWETYDDTGAYIYCTERGTDGSLKKFIKTSPNTKVDPITPNKVFQIAKKLCKVLGSFHQKGIVHRDVGPGNIVLSHFNPLGSDTTDFDLKLIDHDTNYYISGSPGHLEVDPFVFDPLFDELPGTIAYAAPFHLNTIYDFPVPKTEADKADLKQFVLKNEAGFNAVFKRDRAHDHWAVGETILDLLDQSLPIYHHFDPANGKEVTTDLRVLDTSRAQYFLGNDLKQHQVDRRVTEVIQKNTQKPNQQDTIGYLKENEARALQKFLECRLDVTGDGRDCSFEESCQALDHP